MKGRTKALRTDMTDAERLLWERLRAHRFHGLAFRRQVPMSAYVADFACHSEKLVIELDGGQHAENEAKDAERDAWFARRGYRVARYWNNDVLGNLEGVLEDLSARIAARASPPSLPSPARGEGSPREFGEGASGESDPPPPPLRGRVGEGGDTLSAKRSVEGEEQQ